MNKKRRADSEICHIALYRATLISKWLLCALMLLASFYMISKRLGVSKPVYIIFIAAALPLIIRYILKLRGVTRTPVFPMLCHDFSYSFIRHVSESISLLLSYCAIALWQSVIETNNIFLYYLPTACLFICVAVQVVSFAIYLLKIKKRLA